MVHGKSMADCSYISHYNRASSPTASEGRRREALHQLQGAESVLGPEVVPLAQPP